MAFQYHALKASVVEPVTLWLGASVGTRSTRRVAIYSAVLVWLALMNVWMYRYRHLDAVESASSIYENIADSGENAANSVHYLDIAQMNKADLPKNPYFELYRKYANLDDTRGIDSHLSNYDYIFARHDVLLVLGKLLFQQRCDLYFSSLYADDVNWFIDPKKRLPLENRYQYSFADFRVSKLGEAREEYAKEKELDVEKVEDHMVEDRVRKKYDEFWTRTLQTEQTMTDYFLHVRIFNRCYITGDDQVEVERHDSFVASQHDFVGRMASAAGNEISVFEKTPEEVQWDHNHFESCLDIEKRVYPWLAMTNPLFQHYKGPLLNSVPVMADYLPRDSPALVPTNKKAHNGRGSKAVKSPLTNNKACFLNGFKNKLNGKGIVLSIKDDHAEDTVNLINLLRALGNRYPIQIVYYKPISVNTKKKIVNAARLQFLTLPQSYQAVQRQVGDLFVPADRGLPKQEVWFVNVHNVVLEEYKPKFEKFANKFLATMFNSFEEFILLDADTVLLQPPEFFFNIKGYKQKGAYFYRDRTAPQFRPPADATFFKKMTPSVIDTAMFDIPIITKHTMDLEFFQGMDHFMESGLVVIDRARHFNSVLMMIQMNFAEPVTSRVYGDKEIFFLAFATNGDEGYEFNKYLAAAIGEETPLEYRLTEKGDFKKSREICSPHPGHISGDDGRTLVWLNSGFKFCGQSEKIDYQKELDQKGRFKQITSVPGLENLYRSPLHIKAAIIPPFTHKLETLADNVEEEPKEGWHMDTSYCNLYLWCAYLQIGGKTATGSDSTQVGKVVEFSEDETQLFAYYADVWMGNE